MKKFFLLAIVAVMAVAGSTFAYTYTTATASINVTAPNSDFAAVTAGNVTAPQLFGRFTGTWPTGTLFNITPDPEYPGDLVLKVYLVNAAALSRYYQHSNISLQFTDNNSQAVDEQKIFQLLNLDNAEVEFTWANGTGTPPYKVEITGGSYKMHPWKQMTGGSVQPQLWCEITQR